jgi:hypothetical protein
MVGQLILQRALETLAEIAFQRTGMKKGGMGRACAATTPPMCDDCDTDVVERDHGFLQRKGVRELVENGGVGVHAGFFPRACPYRFFGPQ